MVRELCQELLRSAQVFEDEIKDIVVLDKRPIHAVPKEGEASQRRVSASEYPVVEFAVEICQGRC
jgi:hypothetical protein